MLSKIKIKNIYSKRKSGNFISGRSDKVISCKKPVEEAPAAAAEEAPAAAAEEAPAAVAEEAPAAAEEAPAAVKN